VQELRALYDAHAAALFGFALRLTGDRGQAEDVVQETLLRAWRRRPQTHGDTADLRPWLLTVARRVVIDGYRARRARPAEVADDVLAALPDADVVDAALDRIVMLDALGALSDEHRSVLVELYYRGRSVAEAATELGVPAGTVKSRSYYALRALRLALVERGVLS
jgi:RNA polymerase sigma-70 factor (ECF subfamily)